MWCFFPHVRFCVRIDICAQGEKRGTLQQESPSCRQATELMHRLQQSHRIEMSTRQGRTLLAIAHVLPLASPDVPGGTMFRWPQLAFLGGQRKTTVWIQDQELHLYTSVEHERLAPRRFAPVHGICALSSRCASPTSCYRFQRSSQLP
jgi:hypothetical protein